jgi:small subunit ribosomal protein S20
MPIIKSAKKRVRQAASASARNARTKRILRSALKTFEASVAAKKGVAEAQNKALSALDQAAKKGLLHKNKVARKKAQLARAAKAAGAKVEKKAVAAKKTVAKKTTPKKTVTKKPAAKKPSAKKLATKSK